MDLSERQHVCKLAHISNCHVTRYLKKSSSISNQSFQVVGNSNVVISERSGKPNNILLKV